MRTVEQRIRAYLTERRLDPEEVVAVMKSLRTDTALNWVNWSADEEKVSGHLVEAIEGRTRRKVIAWMDKNNEAHKARCLFTGES